MLARSAILLPLLLISACSLAQNLTEEFRRTYNGGFNGNDRGVDLTIDPAGNIYVLGSTEISGTNIDFLVRKYDPAGNELWTRIFGTAGIDTPKVIKVDSSLNVFAMGMVPDSGAGDTKILVRKMDSEGDQIFQSTYELSGDPGADNGNDMVVDDDGAAYVAASCFQGSTNDFVVFKFNAAGTQVWQHIKMGAAGSSDSANALVVSGGFVYATGVVRLVASDSDISTIKLNAGNGQQAWFTHVTQNYTDSMAGKAIGIDSKGRIVVAGDVKRTDNFFANIVVRLSPANGLVVDPVTLNNNQATVNFNASASNLKAMSLGYDDYAYMAGEATLSGTPCFMTTFGFPGGGGGGQGNPGIAAQGLPAAGGVVADTRGAGFYVGTLGSSSAGEGRNINVRRLRNGNGSLTMEINGTASLEDIGEAVALDVQDNILVLGSSKAANGKFDIILLRIDQPPFSLGDTYHMFQGQSPFITNVADGVKRNDPGSAEATASQNGAVVPPEAGNVGLQQTGEVFFNYVPEFTGTASFQYVLQKGGFLTDPTTVYLHVHPHITNITLPASIVGGENDLGTVTFSGNEAQEGYPGTLTTNNPSVISFPSTFFGSAGMNTTEFVINTIPIQNETIATITASRGGTMATGNVLIKAGGLHSLILTPNTVIGGESVQGSVTLTGAAGTGGTTVNLSSNSGSVIVPATTTVAEGTVNKTFTVNTTAVNGTFTRTVSATRGLITKTANLTLKPKPVLTSLALSPTTVYGGQSTTGTVTLTAAAGQSGATVTLSDNTSSINTPANVVVANNATTGQFTATTTDVAANATRTITASFDGVNKAANLTLVPSPDLNTISLSPSALTGGQSSTCTVTLTASATQQAVVIAISDNSSAISTPPSTTVAQNTSSKQFPVNTSAVGASATRQVSATLAGLTKSANLTLHPSPTLTSLTVTPTSVKGGTNATGKVTYNVPAGIGGNPTNLSDNSSSITVPASVQVPQGATQANFNITTSPVASTATRQITASRNGVTKTANLTLTP